jgi:hypothetical protein
MPPTTATQLAQKIRKNWILPPPTSAASVNRRISCSRTVRKASSISTCRGISGGRLGRGLLRPKRLLLMVVAYNNRPSLGDHFGGAQQAFRRCPEWLIPFSSVPLSARRLFRRIGGTSATRGKRHASYQTVRPNRACLRPATTSLDSVDTLRTVALLSNSSATASSPQNSTPAGSRRSRRSGFPCSRGLAA